MNKEQINGNQSSNQQKLQGTYLVPFRSIGFLHQCFLNLPGGLFNDKVKICW